jgi:8-oxo-dGTP pyrophosphatase MutT (NUDIX family)
VNPVPFDATLRARLAANLGRLAPLTTGAHALKHAAVCILVTDAGDGSAALLVTRRAARLNSHAGQYALPGGRLDEGESALEAAMREAREEIGLELSAGAFLGRLDDYPTRSGYLITPLVAWLEGGRTLVPNPAEVERIYRLPIADLGKPGSPEFIAIPESDRPVIRYPVLGTLLHAPTAAVLYQFMEVAVLGRLTRVAHLEQPVWAWK